MNQSILDMPLSHFLRYYQEGNLDAANSSIIIQVEIDRLAERINIFEEELDLIFDTVSIYTDENGECEECGLSPEWVVKTVAERALGRMTDRFRYGKTIENLIPEVIAFIQHCPRIENREGVTGGYFRLYRKWEQWGPEHSYSR